MENGKIQSMTGYGESVCCCGDKRIEIAVISLNGKVFELQAEIPSSLQRQMGPWRKRINDRLHRGRVTLVITEKKSSQEGKELNQGRILHHFSALESLAKQLDATTDTLGWAIKAWVEESKGDMPLVFTQHDITLIEQGVIEAVEQCLHSRLQEGMFLKKHLQTCINTLQGYLEGIVAYLPERKQGLKDRFLEQRHTLIPHEKEAHTQWEKEVSQYLDKVDLGEEVVRLEAHLAYFKRTMEANRPIGKQLGFIAQEINRELSTIGAKAQDIKIQHWTVEMKEALEQIKEQLQNTL